MPINADPGKEREKIALEIAKLTKRLKSASKSEEDEINERIKILRQQQKEIPVQKIDEGLQEHEIYKVNRGFLLALWNKVISEVSITIREVRFKVFHKKVESMFGHHRVLFFDVHKQRVSALIKQKTEVLNKAQSSTIKEIIQRDIDWLKEKEQLQFTTPGALKPYSLTDNNDFAEEMKKSTPKRKRTETVIIGDIQPPSKKVSDLDVQIISENKQSSMPSMKSQLEEQQKAVQALKKEQSAVSQAARSVGSAKIHYQRKGKKSSSSLSSETISSLDVNRPISPSQFIISESAEQATEETSVSAQERA